ncbi:MAG: hypothetical protein KC425_15940, partial [Anaerolineales bacterium]|nr:hypothetical protein [Anaerolineales bacterium]
RRLAPFSVPAAPAFFFGRVIYHAADGALPVAVFAALGLESAGIVGAHLAVKFYARRDGKWKFAAALTAVYLVVGIATILLLETASADARAVGVAMFLIAGIVYTLLGLAEVDRAAETAVSQSAVRQDATAAAERQMQHELELARLQYGHEEKLARIDAKTAAKSRQDVRQVAGNLPADWRQLTDAQKRQVASMTGEQLAVAAPHLADRTRRAWLERAAALSVNGQHGGDV